MRADFFSGPENGIGSFLFKEGVPLDLTLDCFGKLKIFNKNDSDLVQKEVQ